MSSDSKSAFFRQSGWMLFATLASGVFMFAVHPAYVPFLGEKAYGDFQAILSMLNVMVIPGLGLQTVFAQQTAGATSSEERDRLTATVHTLLRWTFFLWLVMAATALIFQGQILDRLKIPDALALWITVTLGL